MKSDIFRRLRAPLFWLAIVAVYIAAIMPASEAPTLGFADKTDHLVAFFTLTILGRLAYQRLPRLLLVGGLLTLGIIIEISQAVPSVGRDASVLDVAWDCAGIIVGLLAAGHLYRRHPVLFQ